MELLLAHALRVPGRRRQADAEYLIFTHAHGWQHNADACDNNVVCFQRLLERMDVSERSFNREAPRKIVGVFVAWRGRLGPIPKLSATSFYSRKGRAAGSASAASPSCSPGSTTSATSRTSRAAAPGTKTQLIISGHSFGGQVIYKALAQPLIERATRMSRRNPAGPASSDYGYGSPTASATW